MDERVQNSGVQVSCPYCKKPFPVRVQHLEGRLRLSVRCPHCKRLGEIVMQDIK